MERIGAASSSDFLGVAAWRRTGMPSVTRRDALAVSVMVLVVGYHAFTKQFAYLGIQSVNVFIGELFLGFCLLRPQLVLDPWLTGLMRWRTVSPLAFGIFIVLGYGIWQTARGILSGHPVIPALQELAFNYYPLYLLIGLQVGRRDPTLLPRIVRVLAVVNGVYGTIYVLFIQGVADFDALSVNGNNPGIWAFGQPGASVFSILGLLCFEPRLRIALPLIFLNAFTLLGIQVRAEWLALTITLTVWGVLRRRVGEVLVVWIAFFVILWSIDVIGIRLPGRTSDISLSETVSRVLAPADLQAAKEFARDAKDHEGSVLFRTLWWQQIWRGVNADPRLFLIGYGYGFPLRSLVADWDPNNPKDDVRSPHNAFFFAFGYSGWIGALAFFGFQAVLGWTCWKKYRVHGAPFIFLYWSSALIIGLLGNNFETPFGAIPFYLLCGLGIAPLIYPAASAPCEAGLGRPLERPLPNALHPPRASASRRGPATLYRTGRG
jgi:hypothetical protein